MSIKNFNCWNSINSNQIKKNDFGVGICITDNIKPIYIPVLNVKETNLNYVHDVFYKAYRTYNLLTSNQDFSEIIKKIDELSRKSFLNLDDNKFAIGSYLELLMLRRHYMVFNMKDINFRKFDMLINRNRFNTPYLNLSKYMENLNQIGYEVHNSFID